MSRNRLAGTKSGTSNSAKFYQENESSRKKKQEYDAEYNSSPTQRRRRSILLAINRKKKTNGNLDGMDEAHISKSKTVKQDQGKNRGDKKRIFFGKKKKKRG
jgi:hypothetical protein